MVLATATGAWATQRLHAAAALNPAVVQSTCHLDVEDGTRNGGADLKPLFRLLRF